MPTALEYAALAGIVLLVLAAGFMGRRATAMGLGPWYDRLEKSPLTPPGPVIAVVWALLYAAMAVAAWLVLLAAGWPAAALPLGAFGVQLAFNAAWSVTFFAMRRPFLALVNLDLLWLSIVATIVLFGRHSALAAGLLIPYLAWVSLAGYLNFEIWRNNPHPRLLARIGA